MTIPGLPNPWLILGTVLALIGAYWGGNIAGHRAEREHWEAAQAKATAAAVQAALERRDKEHAITLAAAVHDAQAQERVVTRTLTITKEIPRYVKDTAGCITVGLVRVLDAAVHGADPAELPLAPGQFDETCAPITASALAEAVVRNYGACHGNAEQLTGLQVWIARTHASR
jgi:hypothetical protein